MRLLLNLLREPLLDSVDVDSDERMSAHGQVLKNKKMLRLVFEEMHHLFRKTADKYFVREGLEIELGAGVAPMRDSYPDVLATDVVLDDNLDRELNAEDMDLRDNSVRVFYGQNCFHHFPHPARFFSELERTLVPGGGAIILEPFYGPIASFLFKRLFATEGFDKSYPSWEVPATGPMHGANQALSYIVFVRDREQFQQQFPSLEIVDEQRVNNYLKYLISGGLNFRQLLPDSMIGLIDWIEKLLSPLNRWLALHHVVVLRKVDTKIDYGKASGE